MSWRSPCPLAWTVDCLLPRRPHRSLDPPPASFAAASGPLRPCWSSHSHPARPRSQRPRLALQKWRLQPRPDSHWRAADETGGRFRPCRPEAMPGRPRVTPMRSLRLMPLLLVRPPPRPRPSLASCRPQPRMGHAGSALRATHPALSQLRCGWRGRRRSQVGNASGPVATETMTRVFHQTSWFRSLAVR